MKSLLLSLALLASHTAFAETKIEQIQDQRIKVPAGPHYDNSRPFFGRQLLDPSYKSNKSFFIHQGYSQKPGYYSTLVSLDTKSGKLETITALAFSLSSSLEVFERLDEKEKSEDILRVHQFNAVGNSLVYTALEFDMNGKLVEQIRPTSFALNVGDDPSSFRVLTQIDPTRGKYMQDDYVPGFLVSLWNQQSKSRVIYYLQADDEYGTEMTLRTIDGLAPTDLVVGAYHIGSGFDYIVTRGTNGQFQVYQLSAQFPKRYVWLPLATETVKPENFFNAPAAGHPFNVDYPNQILEQVTFVLPGLKNSEDVAAGEDIVTSSGPYIGGYVVAELRGTKFYVTQTDANTRLQRTGEQEGELITVKDGELCKSITGTAKPTCVKVNGTEPEFINIVNVDRQTYYAVKTDSVENSTEGQFVQLYDAKTLALSYQIPTTGDWGVEVESINAPDWHTGTWVIIKRTYEISATLLKSVWIKK